MKIIDLLNKIANGEEVPKKIRYSSYIFKYTGDKRIQRLYVMENQDNYLLRDFVVQLNSEVEIIEEKEMCHKCGKYPCEYNQTYCEFCLGISEEDKKIEKMVYCEENTFKNMKVCTYLSPEEKRLLDSNFKELGNKINEIIDYLNKGNN